MSLLDHMTEQDVDNLTGDIVNAKHRLYLALNYLKRAERLIIAIHNRKAVKDDAEADKGQEPKA